jgi:hypothetical protein
VQSREGYFSSKRFTRSAISSFPVGAPCGHEKKFKNDQNCKFGLNEIKYLQLLIFAKRDFFSRPQSSRRIISIGQSAWRKGRKGRKGNLDPSHTLGMTEPGLSLGDGRQAPWRE